MPEYITDEEVRFESTVYFGLLTARQGVYWSCVECFLMIMLFQCNPVVFVPLGVSLFVCAYMDFPKLIYEPLNMILFNMAIQPLFLSIPARFNPSPNGFAKALVTYIFCPDGSCVPDRHYVILHLSVCYPVFRGFHWILENAKKASDYEKKQAVQEEHNVGIRYLE